MTEDKIDIASIRRLAGMIASQDMEAMWTGKRELWQLVRHVGKPGNELQQQATTNELLALVGADQPLAIRREVIWMLSEIGGDECVDLVAAMLKDVDLREDARLVLQRLPGNKSLAALKNGLAAAPEDFKINVAESLRARGVAVPGLPDEKLKPCRQTKVTPVGR